MRLTVLSGAILSLSENDGPPSLYQKKFIVDSVCMHTHVFPCTKLVFKGSALYS